MGTIWMEEGAKENVWNRAELPPQVCPAAADRTVAGRPCRLPCSQAQPWTEFWAAERERKCRGLMPRRWPGGVGAPPHSLPWPSTQL